MFQDFVDVLCHKLQCTSVEPSLYGAKQTLPVLVQAVGTCCQRCVRRINLQSADPMRW